MSPPHSAGDGRAGRQQDRVGRRTPKRSYRSDLEQLADFLGDRDLAGIGHQDLRQFLGHLITRKVKKSSLARKLSAVRAYFKYLNARGSFREILRRLIAWRTPKQDKRLPSVLTVDDALRLMNAPQGNAVR